jgi:hypothetical protein
MMQETLLQTMARIHGCNHMVEGRRSYRTGKLMLGNGRHDGIFR